MENEHTGTESLPEEAYEMLKLENQLCFPLYAAAREVIRQYRPHLDALDLTYTQYITLMVLWASDGISVKALGEKLLLDSGTLTPMLKSMEKKALIARKRDSADERVLRVYLTEEGRKMKEKAVFVPAKVGSCIRLTKEEGAMLYSLLYKILNELPALPEEKEKA